MSRNSREKSSYARRTVGGVLGITALAVLLTGGATVLALRLGLPLLTFSVLLCVLVTAVAVSLAVSLGRRSVQDATVFFLAEGDRLFVMDARQMVDQGRNAVDNAVAAVRTQQLLRQLALKPGLTDKALEILKVESLKDKGRYISAVCKVRNMAGKPFRHTCFLVRGLENEEELIRQLERRKSWKSGLEWKDDPYAFQITLRMLALFGFAALGILSHPAMGDLPEFLYYPSLLGELVSCFFLLWTLVRRRRGE